MEPSIKMVSWPYINQRVPAGRIKYETDAQGVCNSVGTEEGKAVVVVGQEGSLPLLSPSWEQINLELSGRRCLQNVCVAWMGSTVTLRAPNQP